MPSPAASQKAIERALIAAKAAGLQVTGFSVSKDGTVAVTTKTPVDNETVSMHPREPKRWAKR